MTQTVIKIENLSKLYRHEEPACPQGKESYDEHSMSNFMFILIKRTKNNLMTFKYNPI
jgi:hypothetical protein